MNITFERATPNDVETLVKLQIRAFHEDARLYPGVKLGGPPGYASASAMLEKMTQEDYYKIMVDGQIAGGMGIINLGRGHYHLDVIYIDPAYHNQGIGTQAIHFIERTYAAAKRWTLNTPGYAIRNQHFYEKFGYIKVGEEPFEYFTLIDYEKRI
ncbi:MAG: GNAT family N-acetyltransferase [Anaerolineaceae bacterium]|nr:GNAT family N-acetyltransferase [Anaerolineaceae bacterium]